jgi:hypothetical protein
MSERKTISINPELFKVTSNTTRKKQPKTEKNKDIRVKSQQTKQQNNKTLRGKLLKYIREQQEKNYEKNANRDVSQKPPTKNPLDEFNSEFDNSLKYLMSVAEENEKKQKHNSTLKQYPNNNVQSMLYNDNVLQNVMNTMPNVTSEIPALKLNMHNPNYPKYGCLKGGTLPTYRSWKNQTQRKPPSLNDQYISSIPYVQTASAEPIQENYRPPLQSTFQSSPMPSMAPITPQNTPIYTGAMNVKNELEKEIERQKARIEMKQIMERTKPQKMPKLKYLKQKRTLKRTYHVGKSRVFPKVAVLVSNKTIRNNITTKKQMLNQTPIEEIRKFLLKKGFIKVGSTSPNDVLRKMYESVHLICGEVQNHNPENLLYNFIHGDK